jgi:hypothetical protein
MNRKLRALVGPIFFAGLAVVMGFARPAPPAQAQGETFPLIDQVIGNYLPRLASYQASYVIANGRYFQGLWSHSAVPDESASLEPDQLTLRPTDQLEDFAAMWLTVRIAQGRLPLRFRIDVYNGPCGQGYVILIEVTRLGQIFTRAINVGCETWRDIPWRRLAEVAP